MSASEPTNWTRVANRGETPPYAVYNQPIEKSQQDDRDYRMIRLENGLHAMLVRDENADKAAASLDVAIGHLYDPDDVPGLAHFCEHLLFMGTEQFPRENEYSEYLAKNNGHSNAYTSTSNTNYYFSVATSALPGALERFSGFFHSPLFAPSCTTRELNAVDSEHKKNHQNDAWRVFQLNKELSRPGHVWRKFGSGNKESLSRAGRELKEKGKLKPMPNGNGKAVDGVAVAPSPIPSRMASPAPSVASSSSDTEADGGAVGRETRRRLVEWWSKEYCASRMRLCVIGREPLDEMADMVSSLFSPIKNRGRDPLPMINEHPFGPDEVATLVSVQTIMSFHAVEISFPLAWQPPYYRTKPGAFIGHFVGHEGPGSVYSYLKSKGWITSLSSGVQNLGRGFSMFKATVHLTQDGFRNHEDVILAIFKYLSLLRSADFPAWHQREIATLQATRFRFLEKTRPDDYAVWVAEQMAWPVPRARVLSAPQLVEEWDPDGCALAEVREVLAGLTIERGRAVLMAKGEEHATLGRVKEWKQEPVYGTEYWVEKFDPTFIAKANSVNDIPDLFLPGPNEFIPTNLDVDKRDVAEPTARPHLIRETPQSVLWHKKDDQFWVPKAHMVMDIRSPVANASPKQSVMTRLFADLVNDSLAEFSYAADLAGLSYNFASHTLGLWITLSGYNDKMGVLAQHVLEKVKALEVDPTRLAVMKEQLERDWKNFFMGQSYRISDYYGRYMMSEKQWTLGEKLPLVASVTAEEVQKHAKEVLSAVHLRVLTVGNVYKDEAIKILEAAESTLGSSPLPASQVLERALLLPDGANFVWSTPVPNPNEPNSSLTYYLHYGAISDPTLRVTAALLTQILTEPAFNILRTKEQLGYIVSCSTWQLDGDGHAGVRIVVQSERGPAYLEERVEAFLVHMRGVIEEMSEEDFVQQKEGLEKKWRERPKNMNEETNRYWAHVESGYLDFHRRQTNVEIIQRILKSDVLALFNSAVDPSSPTRAKLSVHAQSRKPKPKRVSRAAAAAFEEHIKALGITYEPPDVDGDEPSIVDYGKAWSAALGNGEDAKKALAALPTLLEKNPAASDAKGTVSKDATVIEDVKAFKAGLAVSEDPKPLVEWGDLPISKF